MRHDEVGHKSKQEIHNISYKPYIHSLKVNFNIHETKVHSLEFSTCDAILALKKF